MKVDDPAMQMVLTFLPVLSLIFCVLYLISEHRRASPTTTNFARLWGWSNHTCGRLFSKFGRTCKIPYSLLNVKILLDLSCRLLATESSKFEFIEKNFKCYFRRN